MYLMSDHLIHLPEHFQFINQFLPSTYAPTPSKMRCGPASTAMAAEIAYPGRWNPVQLEHDLYVKWAGPDVASDTNGTSKEQILAWLHSVGIGFIDMQPLVDELHRGNPDPLRLELGHQNAQGVPQIITVFDEAYLRQAVPNPQHASNDNNPPYLSGPILHNWTNPDDPNHPVYHHVIFRVGYSDSDSYGLYAEPAAPAFCQDSHGNFTPVKILWADILKAGIMSCIAIMPAGVPTPPAGFSYVNGTWPVPKPAPIDPEAVALAVEAHFETSRQKREAAQAALEAQLLNFKTLEAAETADEDAFMKAINQLLKPKA